MRFQRAVRALLQKTQHLFRVERGEQDSCILLHDAQQRVIIAALPVGRHGVKILPMVFIPHAEALAVNALPLGRHLRKRALRAFLQHVVKAVGRAVRQALDKGVLSGEGGEQRLRAVVIRDGPRHLDGEFVGETHDREKFLLPLGEWVDHRGGEDGENIGIAVGERTVLGKHPQVQIDGGKPALAVIQQGLKLLVGEHGAAAAGVDGELGAAEAQLRGADLINLPAETDDLRGRHEGIAACDDEVDIRREPRGERAEKRGRAPVGQQVEIVDEDIAGAVACERVAEVVDEQTAAGGIGRTGVVLQKIQTGSGEGVLHAPPEDGEVVGIDADAEDERRFLLCALGKVPFHRCRLSVAHRRDDGRQRAARHRAQTVLKPLGYVDGIQIPFGSRHGASLP